MNDREAILLLSHLPTFTPLHLKSLKDMGLSCAELIENPRILLELYHCKERERRSNLCSEIASLPKADPSSGENIPETTPRKDGFNQAFIQKIEDIKAALNPAQILDECHSKDIQIICFTDPEYPKFLKEIHKPPVVLYLRGNLIPEDEISVAVVGSRHASPYGMRVASKMSYELAVSGVTIVSGLARGIDGEAHRGALKARGRTIAVLGSGLDVVYPKENAKLYDEIACSGAVVSEFPLGTPPLAYNFPNRNRIIAGLSQGVLIVEAHYRSGSLITASLASEEGIAV